MNRPTLSIDHKLLTAAERVLKEGETLLDFVESSIHAHVQQRTEQNDFVARGLAGRDEARRTNTYFSAEEVLSSLDVILAAATKARSRDNSNE